MDFSCLKIVNLMHGLSTGFWKKTDFSDFFAIPEGCPETFAPVKVLGDAGSQADVFHETIAANAFKTFGEAGTQFIQYVCFFPYVFEAICCRMPENQFRHTFSNAAEGVGTVCQYTQNAQNSACAAPVPFISEHFPQRAEGCRMIINKAQIG